MLSIIVAMLSWLLLGSHLAGSQHRPSLIPCVSAQKPGDNAAAVFADPSRFDCATPAHAWGTGDFWVLYRIPEMPSAQWQDSDPRELRFVPQWQRQLTIFVRDRHGRIVTQRLDDTDLSGLTGIGPVASLGIERAPGEARDILVRVNGAVNANGLMGDVRVSDIEERHQEQLLAAAAFAAFAGLGLGLLCYNIVLWLTIRERFQITYCLSLLAMLAYTWSSSGLLAVQFPGIPTGTRLATSYVMLAFVGALAVQFITDFIERDMLPARLRSIARHMGVGCVAAALIVVAVPPEWRWAADRAYVISFLPLPPLVVAIAVIAWRRGSAAIRFLAVAWLVPLLMAVARIAHAMHFLDYGVFIQYAMVAAMSIEALLSSLAMSYRIKRITDERDRAVADERVARHLASVDALTGLLNRRALLEQVIIWSSPEPLRMLIVDVDRFKQVNDQHGHLMGDEVLRGVAEVLAIRADLRASVARMGGEEFALIGTAAELSEGVALGILADLRSRPMAGDVRVTVSIGMAEGMVRSEAEWRQLYHRADTALYLAKSEGRNRAVHIGPEGAQVLEGQVAAVA